MTSVDVDDYLVKAAAERLASAGLHPEVTVCDATGPPPGSYDRIVSMMSVAPIPASWLAALRSGGRMVTVLAGTGLLATASDDGPPAVHQAGPAPDGGVRLKRGRWQAAIPADWTTSAMAGLPIREESGRFAATCRRWPQSRSRVPAVTLS